MNVTSHYPSSHLFGLTAAGVDSSPTRHRPQPHHLNRTTSRHFNAFTPHPSANPWLPSGNDETASLYETVAMDRLPTAERWAQPLNVKPWEPNAFAGIPPFNMAMHSASRMPMTTSRSRGPIPQPWLNHSQSMAALGSGFQQNSAMNGQMAMNLGAGLLMDAPFDDSDDLILTAIVIKNIPFAVRKEQIVQLMTEMALPLPYAFNYHFDSGVFRGLAFANFTTPDETHVVIGSLNGFDIQGRKLRVEYKKMLPLHERERIERLKRERRGQLEEQHRPIGQPPSMMTLNHQPSLASMASMSSIPDSSGQNPQAGQPNMNDPDELRNYLALLELSRDPNHEDIILDSSLTPMQRRKIHEMAHYLGLQHMSYGKPNDRRIHISHANNQQPLGQNGLHPMVYPQHQIPTVRPGDGRRQLTNRAVTFEYNASEPGGAPRGPSSLLDIPGSPANGVLNMASNLRGAKSVADLRSYSPSPAPSAASYCMNVPLKDVNGATTNNERSGPSTVTAGTPQHTGSTSSLLLRRGDEERMIGAIGSLHLNTTGNAFGVGANSAASSESRSARGAFNFGGGSETQPPIGTAIGSSRTVGRAFGTDYKSHSATAAARSPGFPQPSRFGTSLANGSASARGILTNGSTMHGRHPSSSPESHHD